MGIETICGSVIKFLYPDQPYTFDGVREANDKALFLREQYGDFYYPGLQVHPKYVKESIAEIERFHKLGFCLIGELVPYIQDWPNWQESAYDSPALYEILEAAEALKMVVNIHSLAEDSMDALVKRFKNLKIVAAHPGERREFSRHLNRMEMSENYYLDTSGTGVFRHGVLRHGIDEFGSGRFIYGSDYPVCSPACQIGAITLDYMLSEEEKQKILYQNAADLLGI